METIRLFMPICHLKNEQALNNLENVNSPFSIFTPLPTVNNKKINNITFLAVLYTNKTKEIKFTNRTDYSLHSTQRKQLV